MEEKDDIEPMISHDPQKSHVLSHPNRRVEKPDSERLACFHKPTRLTAAEKKLNGSLFEPQRHERDDRPAAVQPPATGCEMGNRSETWRFLEED